MLKCSANFLCHAHLTLCCGLFGLLGPFVWKTLPIYRTPGISPLRLTATCHLELWNPESHQIPINPMVSYQVHSPHSNIFQHTYSIYSNMFEVSLGGYSSCRFEMNPAAHLWSLHRGADPRGTCTRPQRIGRCANPDGGHVTGGRSGRSKMEIPHITPQWIVYFSWFISWKIHVTNG